MIGDAGTAGRLIMISIPLYITGMSGIQWETTRDSADPFWDITDSPTPGNSGQ